MTTYERCYLEPMINGCKRVFLPNDKEVIVAGSSLFEQKIEQVAGCWLSLVAKYEDSKAFLKVKGVKIIYVDRAPKDTKDTVELSVGSVVEVDPGVMTFILELSNLKKECINLGLVGKLDLMTLRSRLFKWEMFTGGQLFVCTSAGFDPRRRKVAGFDLDGTIIKSNSGGPPKNAEDWTFWDEAIHQKLNQLQESGYKIILFTNQAGILKSETSLNLYHFKIKIENVMNHLKVPVQVHIASYFGGPYRKPVPGMWRLMERSCGTKTKLNESFFVGDAAGRNGDISSSDLIFAKNVGVAFHTPEEFFLDQPPQERPTLRFLTEHTKKEMPDLEVPSRSQEVIVMVGPPCSGKTFFVQNYLMTHEYVPVSLDYFDDWNLSSVVLQDVLLKKNNAVVDRTNCTVEERSRFIKLCKILDVKTRCFVMDWTANRVLHNNKFKKIFRLDYEDLSPKELGVWRTTFEAPTIEEGFASVLNIPFVPKFICDEWKFLYNSYLHTN